MSDLCMYELEDIVWDDFSQWHEVPDPSNKQACGNSSQHDSHRRAGGDVSFAASDALGRFPVGATSQEKTEHEILTQCNELNKTLEKEGWYQKPGLVLSSSCNSKSFNEVPSLVTGGTRISNLCSQNTEGSVGSELCTSKSIRDKSDAVGSSFGCALDNMPEVDNDLKFFGNINEDMDSSDFLYHGWPDVGSFEDVDQMFGSCDSTFGLGSRNANDLGSFNACGGSKLSCPESIQQKSIAANLDASRLNCMSGSANKSNVQNSFVLCQGSSCSSADDESSALGYFSFSNLSKVSDSEDDCIPEGQFDEQKEKLKHQNQGERIKNDQAKKSVCIDDKSESVQAQARKVDSAHYLSVQSDYPYSHPCDHNSMDPTTAAAKSRNSDLTFLSLEDSYILNQVQSDEGSNDHSFQGTSTKQIEKREIQHHPQGLRVSFNNSSKDVNLTVQASMSGTTKKENVVCFSAEEIKNPADDRGVDMEIPGELSSATTSERSSICSGSDDASEESTRFSQLQLVMERLDTSVKICIRDSLYRLAWSAKQRHNLSTLNGGTRDFRDAPGVLFTDGTDGYTDFTDMETETNRIDRSMAHLLFHKPGNSSVMPAQKSVSFN